MEIAWCLLKKVKIELPGDPAIPLLGIYPKELKVEFWSDIFISMTKVASFTVAKACKQPKCPSADEWISKMWYTHNKALFSLKAEENSDICYNMNEPWRHYLNKLSQSQKENIYDSIYMRYLELKPQRQKVEQWLWGAVGMGANEELSLNGWSFSFTRWKEYGDGQWWWLYKIMHIFHTT